MTELVKYSKKLVCNRTSNKAISLALDIVCSVVFKSLEKNGDKLEFFKISLNDSEEHALAKEIQFDWAVLPKQEEKPSEAS